MKHIVLTLAALTAAGCTAGADTRTAQSSGTRADLSEPLQNRVAGEPVSCVNQRLLRGNKSGPDGSIIFEGQNGTLYVNRPVGGCPELNSFRALQTRTSTGQLCRGDIATVFDPGSGTFHGSCGLGDFVPYRRTASR